MVFSLKLSSLGLCVPRKTWGIVCISGTIGAGDGKIPGGPCSPADRKPEGRGCLEIPVLSHSWHSVGLVCCETSVKVPI